MNGMRIVGMAALVLSVGACNGTNNGSGYGEPTDPFQAALWQPDNVLSGESHEAVMAQFADLRPLGVSAREARWLGGLDKHDRYAIALITNGEGLFEVECYGKSSAALIVENQGTFRAATNPDELRQILAPIESAEEAVSYAHLLDRGFPPYEYQLIGETSYGQDQVSLVKEVGGSYKVELVVSKFCAHQSHTKKTYLVHRDGTFEVSGSVELYREEHHP